MLSHLPGFHEAFNTCFVKYHIRNIYGNGKMFKKKRKKNFEGFKSLLEIRKLRLDGNFRPKPHDFNNKNTSLKIELAAAKFDAPWCTMFPLVAGGANTANVPQVAMRRCCVGWRVPRQLVSCIIHYVKAFRNRLSFQEKTVIVMQLLCFPARSMTSAYGGGREMETHQLCDILKVNVHFDLLLF